MKSPARLFEVSGAYWASFALHAAVKLDIFTVIGPEHLSGSEVAEKLKGDQRGVSTLLNALTGMGLLKKSDAKFSNTPMSAEFLSKGSSQYVGHIILHHHHLVDAWRHLDRAVLTGKAVRSQEIPFSGEERESFLMGMFNMAMALAPKATREIDLAGRKHLLDIGGGPGTWAIYFCINNPGLKGTIYDLPTTRPFAEKTIARFGVSDRVKFQEGDYLQDPIEGTFDVAWLSQILHGDGPEDCRTIIRKAVAALSPGGLIMVHEFILENNLAYPLFPALFSLNMLTGTQAGRSYSEEQIRDMLGNAGVRNLIRLPFRSPNDSGIIAGTV